MPNDVLQHDNGLTMIYQGGEWRPLACLPQRLGSPHAEWGGIETPIAAFTPKEVDLYATWGDLGISIDNQGSTSSCVGHGCETTFDYAWLQAGRRMAQFSPTFVYGLINGGRDAGAVISDAATAIKNFGICDAKYAPEGAIMRSQYSAEAYRDAKRHRAIEVLKLNGWQDILQAIWLELPVMAGLLVGRNFGDLDGEGIAPLPDQVLGGHCISIMGAKQSKRSGEWVAKIQNSWSKNWGLGGFAYLTERHFQSTNPDAWAIIGVAQDPDDTFDDVPVAR